MEHAQYLKTYLFHFQYLAITLLKIDINEQLSQQLQSFLQKLDESFLTNSHSFIFICY